MESILTTITMCSLIFLYFFLAGMLVWLTHTTIKSKDYPKDKFLIFILSITSIGFICFCIYLSIQIIKQYF
jgi:hypothetical protein